MMSCLLIIIVGLSPYIILAYLLNKEPDFE